MFQCPVILQVYCTVMYITTHVQFTHLWCACLTLRLLECRSVVASEGLGVWGGLWIQVMGDLLLPLMADLARYVSTRYREFPGVCVCVCVCVCS